MTLNLSKPEHPFPNERAVEFHILVFHSIPLSHEAQSTNLIARCQDSSYQESQRRENFLYNGNGNQTKATEAHLSDMVCAVR